MFMLSSHLLSIFHAPQGPCRTVFWLPIYLVSISVLHIIGNVPCFMITYEKCQEDYNERVIERKFHQMYLFCGN